MCLEQNTHTTIVHFRKFFDDGEVIALFPYVAGTNDPKTCESYMHVGQHGAADYDGVRKITRVASYEEYIDLYTELTESIGYKLKVERYHHSRKIRKK